MNQSQPLRTFINDGVPDGVRVFDSAAEAWDALQKSDCKIALIDGKRNLKLLPMEKRTRAIERTRLLIANTTMATDPRMSDLENPSFELMQFGIQAGLGREDETIHPMSLSDEVWLSFDGTRQHDVSVLMREKTGDLFFSPKDSKYICSHGFNDGEDQQLWQRAARAYKEGLFPLWAVPEGYAVAYERSFTLRSRPIRPLFPDIEQDRYMAFAFRFKNRPD